jgi:hypothetical protein
MKKGIVPKTAMSVALLAVIIVVTIILLYRFGRLPIAFPSLP